MGDVICRPSRLSGSVTLPPSKSFAHRAILCAALAEGESVVSPIHLSEDIKATIEGCERLGARMTLQGDTLYVTGISSPPSSPIDMDCRESGSTLRFLIPIAAALGAQVRFTGQGRLPQRPIDLFYRLLPSHGVTCRGENNRLPLEISGKLTGGVYPMPGDVSSQFVTGFLYALPLCREDSRIRLTTPLQSKGYVAMTLQSLRDFGIEVEEEENGYLIRGGQQYRPRRYRVEADWSQAAFFLAASVVNSRLTLKGLKADSLQGDREAFSLFSRFGASLRWEGEELLCQSDRRLPQRIHAGDIPDLVPALAVAAAYCDGVTVIEGAERLKIKECDRLTATAQNLRAMGCQVETTDDSLTVHGTGCLLGGSLEGFHDHRMVMAFAIAALGADGPVTISDAQSIQKSYPGFFEDYITLGGIADGIDLWT